MREEMRIRKKKKKKEWRLTNNEWKNEREMKAE